MAQITWSAPFTLGLDAEALAGLLERRVPARARRVRRHEQLVQKRRPPAGASAWKPGARAARSTGRGTLSGRRTGSRRRTEIPRAPAASAFSHSVAAAMPAPTTARRRAYSCGSYAWTARGSPTAPPGSPRPGWPLATRRAGTRRAVELETAVDGGDPLDAALNALVPAAPRAQRLDVLEELVDRRVVAVADALRRAATDAAAEPPAPPAPETTSAGSGPSLSERIRGCRIASARRRHDAAGSPRARRP